MSRDSRHASVSPTALLEQRVKAVFRHLPKGLAGDEEAIHDMRVAGRRLQVALPLLARKPRGRRVKRALRVLRKLTRAAGASRDFDVSLDLLDGHLQSQGAPNPERTKLRRHLRGARATSRTRTADALMDLEIARLRRDLRVVLGRGAEDVFSVRIRLRDARDQHGAELVSGFQNLKARFDPEALHALRRRARYLRYLAELGDALRTGPPSEAGALWKSLQERIGRLHDHHVLSVWLAAHAAAAGRGEARLAAEARAQRNWATTTAEALHRELLDARPLDVAGKALAAMGRARSEACAS